MLPLTYMRPEVAGVCVYLFNDDSPSKTRGLLDSSHNPKQSYYAVSEVYAALEEFNDLLADAKCPPVVGLTTQIPQSIIEGRRSYHEIARILYSRGARLQMVPSDELSECPLRSPQKLILTDSILSIDPNGENDSEGGIRKHLEGGGEILYISEKPYEMLYGESDAPANFQMCKIGIDPDNADEIWENLAPFIHDNFLSGKHVEETGIGPESIRILDVQVSNEDLNWSVHPILLYSGKRVIMVIVNTGASQAEEAKITIGFKNSASGWQLEPHTLAAGNDVELSISQSPELPSWWTGGKTQVKLTGLILKNLDTYAFVDMSEVP